MTREETEVEVREIFASNRLAEDRIRALVNYFADPQIISEAYPKHSRHIPVEWVEAYGIRIGVDANGHAACVEFPEGAEHDG